MGPVAWAFLRRDFRLATSYRFSFAAQLVSIVFLVPVLYYVGQVVHVADASSLEAYGDRYFPFLLLGIAFQDYLVLSQSVFNTSIREHQLMGTLEILMLSPTPVPLMLLCSSLWAYVFASVRFALYLLVGVAWGLDLGRTNLAGLGLGIALSILSFAALGILTASVTVVVKRGEAMTMVLTGATVVLGGVVYPVSVLPEAVQWIAAALPFKHALAVVRKAVLLGAPPSAMLPEMLALGASALILFPLGLWAFHLAIRHARVTGTLGEY